MLLKFQNRRGGRTAGGPRKEKKTPPVNRRVDLTESGESSVTRKPLESRIRARPRADDCVLRGAIGGVAAACDRACRPAWKLPCGIRPTERTHSCRDHGSECDPWP